MTPQQELAVHVGLLLAGAYAFGAYWILDGEPHRRRYRAWWFAGMLAVAGAVAVLAHEFLNGNWLSPFLIVCSLSLCAFEHLKRRGVR